MIDKNQRFTFTAMFPTLIVMKKNLGKKSKAYSTTKKKRPSVFRKIRPHVLFYGMFAVLFIFIVTGVFAAFPQIRPLQIPCANSISCVGDLSGTMSSDTQGVFNGKHVSSPKPDYFALTNQFNNVLGVQTGTGEKHIFVDLSGQRLYAYQGSAMVYNFPVSTGKWGLTPTGTFRIWIKLQATRMVGGSGPDYYNLPNVPWTMYFANASVGRGQGYSLHGAYWHNNFGHPMSHGCINIQPDNAKLLYDWADPPTAGYTTTTSDSNLGTIVTIYGTTPNADLVGTQFYNNNVSPNAGSAL